MIFTWSNGVLEYCVPEKLNNIVITKIQSKVNYPAAELRGIKIKNKMFLIVTLYSHLITKQESLLQYFLAFGEAVFIPTAKLWGIKQHFL